MKYIFPSFICFSSLLFAAPEQEIEEEKSFPLKEENSPEVSFMEPDTLPFPLPEQQLEVPKEPLEKLPTKSVWLTTSLSYLFPGLGHLYLKEWQTAGGLSGSFSLGISAAGLTASDESLFLSSIITSQSIWSYGMYAAYRDVRAFNRNHGYSYKMPTDSFTDLTLAPFSWSVLKKPEVWGGFLGAFALATGVVYLFDPQPASVSLSAFHELPVLALPIGIGEESLFRGFYQSMLSEYFTPVGGIIASSLLFGAAHIPNALALEEDQRWKYYSFSLPLITAMGGYFGWLTYKNNSLKESVALHTWYDFTIFAIGAAASKAAIGKTSIALSIPF